MKSTVKVVPTNEEHRTDKTRVRVVDATGREVVQEAGEAVDPQANRWATHLEMVALANRVASLEKLYDDLAADVRGPLSDAAPAVGDTAPPEPFIPGA